MEEAGLTAARHALRYTAITLLGRDAVAIDQVCGSARIIRQAFEAVYSQHDPDF